MKSELKGKYLTFRPETKFDNFILEQAVHGDLGVTYHKSKNNIDWLEVDVFKLITFLGRAEKTSLSFVKEETQ